jgi:SRSO17 transposase
MVPNASWEAELERWSAPFLERIGRAERRKWAPLYLKGLLLPGERKSIEPLAERVCPGDVQQLHHFISTSPWPTAPLQEVLFEKADRPVGGRETVLLFDDTALIKQGKHSVGVARQYCGELGKRANCQSLVTLTLARGEVPVPIWIRLFLPENWTEDAERCDAAGILDAERVHRPKWEIAMEGVDAALAAGVRFALVGADAEYGKAPGFRRQLEERGLLYAVGILPQQRVYPADVVLHPPVRKRPGVRPPTHPTPSVESVQAQAMIDSLGEDAFRTVMWRRGTKGPMRGRFAAVRIRMAEGAPIGSGRKRPAEEEVWLVCEWRTPREKKYYLCNHPPGMPLRTLVRAIKARWSCEQAHEQMKNDLGLDHLECRGWHALQHHTMLVMMAMVFLQHLRIGGKKEGQKPDRTSALSFAARDPKSSRRAAPSGSSPAVSAQP